MGLESWWAGGHSWGAGLALRYALAYPARTQGVVYLCGTDARRIVIDGAGHLPWAEQPAAVAAAIRDFIAGRDPGHAAN